MRELERRVPPAATCVTALVLDLLITSCSYEGRDRLNVDPLEGTTHLSIEASALLAVPPAPVKPVGRAGHTAVWDEQTASMLVFGGRVGSLQARTNELWSLTRSDDSWIWALVSAAGNVPPIRYGHSAVFDSTARRMIVCGGIDGTTKRDVWKLEYAAEGWAWTEIVPTGTLPAPRLYHSAVWDTTRNQMIVFGGTGGFAGTERNDVWVLSENLGIWSWREVVPAGQLPSRRSGHAAAWDEAGDQMIVFGGDDDNFNSANDVWALRATEDGWTWVELHPSGTKPSGRDRQMSAWDPDNQRMLIHGGWNSSNARETWQLRNTGGQWTWTKPEPEGTGLPGIEGAAVWVPSRSELVTFGGQVGSSGGFGTPFGDTLVLPLNVTPLAWTSTEDRVPAPRSLVAAAWNPSDESMLMVGGFNGTSDWSDTWSWTWVGNRWRWRLLSEGPVPRRDHSAVWDAAGAQMIVFGGFRGVTDINHGDFFSETWALRRTATGYSWSQLNPSWGMLPVARSQHTAVWDSAGERMLVYGGQRTDTFYTSDTWILAKAGASWTWTQLPVTFPRPPSRSFHSAVWDPDGNRMIMFGGYNGTNLSDTWQLTDAGGTWAWSQFTPSGTPPSGRFRHSMVWDPVEDRALVFAGGDATGYLSDVWSLTASADGWVWSKLTPTGTAPTVRYQQAAVWDAVGRRMLVFGGRSTSYKNDVWSLTQSGDSWAWSALSGWCETAPPALTVLDPAPNATVVDQCRTTFVSVRPTPGCRRARSVSSSGGVERSVSSQLQPSLDRRASWPCSSRRG